MAVSLANTNIFSDEVTCIRKLKQRLDEQLRTGDAKTIPGNSAFLPDGRVLCLERERGDSRFPYGQNGFNFWVCSSGHMHANKGRFFLFLPNNDGREPQIALFAGFREPGADYVPFSLLPVPLLPQSEDRVVRRYTVIGHDATYFFTEAAAFFSCIRVFLDQTDVDNPSILLSLLLENQSSIAVDTFTSAYVNPFCLHRFFETSEDRWFKKVQVVGGNGKPADEAICPPPFLVTTNEDVSRFESITNRMVIRRSITFQQQTLAEAKLRASSCTARSAYTGGPRRGIAQASFLECGTFGEDVPVTVFNDIAVAGDIARFCLLPSSTIRLDYAISLASTEALSAKQLATEISGALVDDAFQMNRNALHDTDHRLQITVRGSSLEGIDDDTINHFFPYLRTQVRVCAETRGFIQPSPMAMIGIRDIFQAIEGHLFDQPQAAQTRLREALSFVLADGRCPRQYLVPENGSTGPADLREFIDQGAWVISAIHTYCATTGDLDFLNEQVGYCCIDAENSSMLTRSNERDSVLEHLIRIMDYLERNRDTRTRLVYALYGDWNDALDGLGTTATPGQDFGTGVSIMASLQLYRNCEEMAELLTRNASSQSKKYIEKYSKLRHELREGLLAHAIVSRNGERRIVHGWGDQGSYYVGSFCDSDNLARDGLTSNAFWVISGMLAHDRSLRHDILKAMQRLDSPFGMKTFEPGFRPDATGVGRIPKLPIGTAENGATYVHATMFAIMALFLMNEPKRAWEQIHKILPFSPHQKGLSHSPFVLPNSYVHNSDLRLTGQNMNDWQTGCSNVLLKTLIWHVFGFRPQIDSLGIAPATWSPFGSATLSTMAHGRKVKIDLDRDNVNKRTFFVNGVSKGASEDEYSGIPRIVIPYCELKTNSENTIRVVDPA